MGDTDEYRPPTDQPSTDLHHSAFAPHKEGPTVIDRERILAADHEASLQAEARLRRLAAQAAASPTVLGTARRAQVRITLGQWLIGTGRRLDRRADPCGPAEARPAQI